MDTKPRQKSFKKNPINGTKFTIAISSAKGGVGKSTFATNIAIALKKTGCKVGLLDADIYGPSLPKLFSINEKPKSDGKTLNPILKYDIQCMSIGFPPDELPPGKNFFILSWIFFTISSISGGVGPRLKPSPFPPPGGDPHGL